MKLEKSVFDINLKKTSLDLEKFIKIKMHELKRTGIVVTISGGLDSSVIAALCVNAVGKDKVIGLMLPESQGNPDAEKYAKVLAKLLGIKTETRDISPYLDASGAYKSHIYWIPFNKLRNLVAKMILKIKGSKTLKNNLDGTNHRILRQSVANINIKGRMRLIEAYRYAESHNLMVVGSAHLSEDLVGLYVKYGVDDCADLMPLKNLYRTQILELAKYLKIPKEILSRTPNPDIIPGVEDKYKDIIGIDSAKLDLVLYGLEHNIGVGDISKQLGLKEPKVKEIQEIINSSSHMRNHSMAPNLQMEY